MELTKVYSLRQKFTIIAITGRTGSGCTNVTKSLSKGFIEDEDLYPKPENFGYNHNSYRKYRIVYNYASLNFKPFKAIYYKDFLIAFILKYTLKEFKTFLKSSLLRITYESSRLNACCDFLNEIEALSKLEESFSDLHKKARILITDSPKSDAELLKLYDFFESEEFKNVSCQINEILKSQSLIKRNKTLQIIGNNIRKYGHPYKEQPISTNNIFTIAELINDLIKSIRKNNGDENSEIVIDSLRNPYEIMFFKQRYSAFYTFAISRDDAKRSMDIRKRFGKDQSGDIKILLDEEHSGGKKGEFYKQNVSSCIQNADIHIAYKTKGEVQLANKFRIKNLPSASPYFSWGMQLLKFIALIDHPGIITPSPEERCMQLAYTAKCNSGCISRQVGAAICDENYSIKAIGWNSTPEGHVPCSLRNAEDLIDMDKDFIAFTPFERKNDEFRQEFLNNYQGPIQQSKPALKGLNVSYCFKSLINSYIDGKNQVHTRSLHAEESAFLQIAKYGGTGLQNGKLFTTASPCELCSKKAYQLGIKVIYYIDPYPGISKDHILLAGEKAKNPKIRLFYGAIGSSYHMLYEPLMPYKDELTLLLKHSIKDLATKYRSENEKLLLENRKLRAELKKVNSDNVK